MPRVEVTITGQLPETPRPAPDITPSLHDIRVDDDPPPNDRDETEEPQP